MLNHVLDVVCEKKRYIDCHDKTYFYECVCVCVCVEKGLEDR